MAIQTPLKLQSSFLAAWPVSNELSHSQCPILHDSNLIQIFIHSSSRLPALSQEATLRRHAKGSGRTETLHPHFLVHVGVHQWTVSPERSFSGQVGVDRWAVVVFRVHAMKAMRNVVAQVDSRQRPLGEIGRIHDLHSSQYAVSAHATSMCI